MRQYTVTGMTCAACQSHVERQSLKYRGLFGGRGAPDKFHGG
ncbi:MAG: hypothetical protein ACLUIQ_04275 [Dialister invisus]